MACLSWRATASVRSFSVAAPEAPRAPDSLPPCPGSLTTVLMSGRGAEKKGGGSAAAGRGEGAAADDTAGAVESSSTRTRLEAGVEANNEDRNEAKRDPLPT